MNSIALKQELSKPREVEFKAFLDANVRIVYKVCRLYSNTEEEFQDFIQEVVLQMWRSFQSFRGESKASTWVYRVALKTLKEIGRAHV